MKSRDILKVKKKGHNEVSVERHVRHWQSFVFTRELCLWISAEWQRWKWREGNLKHNTIRRILETKCMLSWWSYNEPHFTKCFT